MNGQPRPAPHRSPAPVTPAGRAPGAAWLARLRRIGRAGALVTGALAGSRWRIVLLAAASVVAGLVEAVLFAQVASIAVSMSNGDDTVNLGLGVFEGTVRLGTAFVSAIVLTLVRAVLQLYIAYVPAQLSTRTVTELRARLFDAFSQAEWSVKARERDGTFQTLMGMNVDNASLAVINFARAVTWGLLFLSMLASAIALSPLAAALLALAALVLLIVLQPLGRRIRRDGAALSTRNLDYAAGVQEVAALAEELEVFGRSPRFSRAFHDESDSVRRPLLMTRFLSQATGVLFQSVAILMLVVALVVIWATGSSGIASLAAVVLILVRSMSYGQQFQGSLSMVDTLLPFMRQAQDAIASYLAHPRTDGDRPMPAVRSLAMRDVHYSYEPGTEVLHGVSFEAHAGEVVGIVGPSGAGKSTLTQILLRLRDPSSGTLEVDGVDVASVRRDDWQRRVAYVPQTSHVLHGSVSENIRFYRDDISDTAVEAAARSAGLHDEILTWPGGYDTVLGHRADGLSGGQRQRLCLARALVADPDVLVLDEPTSALDVRSEALVQQSLGALRPGVLVFLVAHRLSTLSICDRVMVVVGGRIENFDVVERLRVDNAFFGEVTAITQAQSS